MSGVYTVAFLGHRYIDAPYRVEKMLEKYIRKFICENEYVKFLVGCSGDFDRCASSSVVRVQKSYRDDNNSLVLILPYLTADYLRNQNSFEEYYGCIEISRSAAKVHPKESILARNREMVDRADLIICYIERESGGAYQAVKYALKHGKRIINLANDFATLAP